MNERIKEFAKQARKNEPFDCSSYTTDQWIEKFAELIIRECAEVAEDYDGAHYVGTTIKQHFGVKE